jgi:cobyrinic acid a,c-diamide synthase
MQYYCIKETKHRRFLMRSQFPRLIVAGLKGGSGKTVLSLGLIAALRKKGLKIVPYKKGPDYIDAGWLSSAARHPCYNLDPFLIGKKTILSSFKEHFGTADCAVIEGNRGLYDGMDAEGTYSSAELAKTLDGPVILILDCTKVTRTAGAMVLGMQEFDKDVDIRGVILNRIAGVRHEKIIRDSVEKYCSIPVLGSIPKLDNDFLSERHMGLTPFQEHPHVKKVIAYTADIAKKYLDIDRIWEIAKKVRPLFKHTSSKPGEKIRSSPSSITHASRIRIGIIRDSAFQFYYPENFEELEKRGVRLIEISALDEKNIPEIDALYIGGGFPETHAIALSENTAFRKSLKSAVEGGLPVYAECGGLMYLGRSIVLDGKTYPMTGVFPVKFCLEKKPQAHGYTIVKVHRSNPFYQKGTELKGHEFHYSRPVKIQKKEGMSFCFTMKRGEGIMDKLDGIQYRNVLATYTHIHALGSPEWADGLIRRTLIFRKRQMPTGSGRQKASTRK